MKNTPYFRAQEKICSITQKNRFRDILIGGGGWDLIKKTRKDREQQKLRLYDLYWAPPD
jgi:hypothetical protein